MTSGAASRDDRCMFTLRYVALVGACALAAFIALVLVVVTGVGA